MSIEVYHKIDQRHPECLELEALGLKWLGEAMITGGCHVVEVVKSGPGFLDTALLPTTSVTRNAAFDFGRALAVTHAGGANHYGEPPYNFSGPGYMGRSKLDLVYQTPEKQTWGDFFANHRILPNLSPAVDNGSIDQTGIRIIERLCQRLCDGEYDVPEPQLVKENGHPAARIHGDLWCGNVMWCPATQIKQNFPPAAGLGPQPHSAARQSADQRDRVCAVLIDPAPSGGHAETDLAGLGVFGQPYLEEIYAGYNQVSPLYPGWKERIGLHQIHMLIVHAHLFGGSYGPHTVEMAYQYI